VAIYLLSLLLIVVVVVVTIAAIRGGAHAVERFQHVASAEFTVTPPHAHPGDELALAAHVRPRGGSVLAVQATLRCTMFDHRPRVLYAQMVTLHPDEGSPFDFTGSVTLPAFAVRTGVIGDQLSNLFSEEARRMLVFWSVDFTVLAAGVIDRPVLERSLAVDVPEGRPLQTDATAMQELVAETFSLLKDDLIFNWLVKMAARDGLITPDERTFLRDVLLRSHGVSSVSDADRRIDAELVRAVNIDAGLLRQHVPAEARVAFYRLLFAVAWRDGVLDRREHEFLVETLREFGLEKSDVVEVERDVLRELALPEKR
jgi:uncharacterized tellurite resistance protein B-like protein